MGSVVEAGLQCGYHGMVYGARRFLHRQPGRGGGPRRSTGCAPSPPSSGFEGPVDRWSEFEYVAPASVLQWGGALDVGRGARQNRNQEGGVSLRLFHHATPETETTCHYFWSVANRNRAPDSPEGERFYRDICDAFLEDKAMIEAQQAAISRDPERGLHYRRHDEAVALARRALHRMSAAELRSAAE